MNDFYRLPVAELEKRYEALARKALQDEIGFLPRPGLTNKQ